MLVTHSSGKAMESSSQPAESATDPNADLFGDWCWKPDRYPADPGKVYDAIQIQAVYPDGYAPGQPSLHHAAIFGPDYAGNPVPPRRIGPVVG